MRSALRFVLAGCVLILLSGCPQLVSGGSTRYSQLVRLAAINQVSIVVVPLQDVAISGEVPPGTRQPADNTPEGLLIEPRKDPLLINVHVPTSLATLMGLAPQGLVVHVCYSNSTTEGRNWRKFSDRTNVDKQCYSDLAHLPFSYNETFEVEWHADDSICDCEVTICASVLCSNDLVCHFACAHGLYAPQPGRFSGLLPLGDDPLSIQARNSLSAPLVYQLLGWLLAPVGPLLLLYMIKFTSLADAGARASARQGALSTRPQSQGSLRSSKHAPFLDRMLDNLSTVPESSWLGTHDSARRLSLSQNISHGP